MRAAVGVMRLGEEKRLSAQEDKGRIRAQGVPAVFHVKHREFFIKGFLSGGFCDTIDNVPILIIGFCL